MLTSNSTGASMALIMVALRKAACILYFRRLMYFCTVTNQNQTKNIKMLQQQIRHPLEARWSVCIYRHCRSESSSLQANLHSDAVAAKSTHTRSVCLSLSLTHTHTHTHSQQIRIKYFPSWFARSHHRLPFFNVNPKSHLQLKQNTNNSTTTKLLQWRSSWLNQDSA